MGKAVQLRGTPNILKAFDSIGIANWALLYDGKILFKCAGDSQEESKETLKGFLTQLEKSRTSAMYVLAFYEELKDRKKIRPSTESDFAYNVEVFDQEEYPEPGSVRRREGYSLIMDRLDVIDAKLALQGDEEETEEAPAIGGTGGWMGAINKILDNPQVQEGLGKRMMQILDSFITPTPPTMNKQLGTIGGTGQQPEPTGPITQISQEQYDKINTAISILAAIDPNLGDNLERIAKLAQENPKKYKSAISMLNTFL